ncbi:septation ring formation regulator EzrA [Bacillus daqingensis]|uniref:Septation ring formation regulator EzrA n=1 Tax=Bacillus daqingensis TaxID=872396 RepID=A0ABV9NZ27_9BACI
MSYVIYAVIALLLAGIIYGALARRNIFKDVDRLGGRKVELMNRPVTEELSKMKGLKLSGETEERFNEWRREWDEIVTVQLPDIEEKLFDIEEAANRYRFGRARQLIGVVEEALSAIEAHINDLIHEVHELVHSEEQNRHDIQRVEEYYQETKKKLWVHRGSLGTAAERIDSELEAAHGNFSVFHVQTEEGNYFQARETLQGVREALDRINKLIDELPALQLKVKRDVPAQLRELGDGIAEMKEQGYPVELLDLEPLQKDLEAKCANAEEALEELDVASSSLLLDEVEQDLQHIYGKLEEEAVARQDAETALPETAAKLEQAGQLIEAMKEELETVRLSYQLSEKEEAELAASEKKWKELVSAFRVLEASKEERNQSFSAIQVRLKELDADIAEVEAALEDMKVNLGHLREDELKAVETVAEKRRYLRGIKRRVDRCSLPRVPDLTKNQLLEAEKQLSQAEAQLEEAPLVMEDVRRAVSEAASEIDKAAAMVDKMVADGELAERVIQYGNRYRTKHDEVQILLLQAEDRFRQGHYEEAVELSVKGVEKVDKQVLDKVNGTSTEWNSKAGNA